MEESLKVEEKAKAICGLKTIIIPITDGNRQGIDDILEAAQELFEDDMAVCQEAYMLKTDNPGLIVLANAIARKATENTVAGSIFDKSKKKKAYNRKPITPEEEMNRL